MFRKSEEHSNMFSLCILNMFEFIDIVVSLVINIFNILCDTCLVEVIVKVTNKYLTVLLSCLVKNSPALPCPI